MGGNNFNALLTYKKPLSRKLLALGLGTSPDVSAPDFRGHLSAAPININIKAAAGAVNSSSLFYCHK